MAQLIAELDNKNFAARQKATAALEKLAELVVPQLLAALEKQPTLEAAKRIEKLLDSIAGQTLPSEKLRQVSAEN